MTSGRGALASEYACSTGESAIGLFCDHVHREFIDLHRQLPTTVFEGNHLVCWLDVFGVHAGLFGIM